MRRLHRRALDDGGFTLVDTLLGVSIMGIGVIAVVGGMATSITVADSGRSSAEGQIAVRAYAEALAATSYSDCATSYSIGIAPPSSLAVTYWLPAQGRFSTPSDPPCSTDSGLQRVTLTVASTDGRATEVLPVAKRRRPAGEP